VLRRRIRFYAQRLDSRIFGIYSASLSLPGLQLCLHRNPHKFAEFSQIRIETGGDPRFCPRDEFRVYFLRKEKLPAHTTAVS
jgi:hypothetical protein